MFFCDTRPFFEKLMNICQSLYPREALTLIDGVGTMNIHVAVEEA